MMKYYISELKNWLETVIPAIINEKNFLLIVGSLFLLGVVTKWMVVRNYGRLARKAENAKGTKNVTIRQIQTKYDSMIKVNGQVENPMLFVQRNINKCKIFHISIPMIANIMNWCMVFIIAVSGIIAYQKYMKAPEKMDWVIYLFLGGFVVLTLEMLNRAMPVEDKKTEFTYAMYDALTRNEQIKNVSEREAFVASVEDAEKEKEQQAAMQEAKEEQILNQVIGEFLQ